MFEIFMVSIYTDMHDTYYYNGINMCAKTRNTFNMTVNNIIIISSC